MLHHADSDLLQVQKVHISFQGALAFQREDPTRENLLDGLPKTFPISANNASHGLQREQAASLRVPMVPD
jgi:hypothetical protein